MRFGPYIASVAALLMSAALADVPKPVAAPVANGVWLIPGGFPPNRQPDGNTVIFAAPDGLIVMDTGRHLWQRQAILDFAKRQGKPVSAIVNSHWHLDHVSGNPDIKRAYPAAKIYASKAIADALTGFLAKSVKDSQHYLESANLPAETADDIRGDIATIGNGKALLPDVIVDESQTRDIAGKTLRVNLAPNAATAGDVWVYDPSLRVAASGDLVTLPVAFLDTACPEGWRRALDEIAATPFRTLIPGHGAPMTRKGFAIYRAAFAKFIDCADSKRASSECAQQWVHDAAALLPDDAARKQAAHMAPYYVDEVLRAHGGKSVYCKA